MLRQDDSDNWSMPSLCHPSRSVEGGAFFVFLV